MVRAIEEETTSTAAVALGFDERLALLVQREIALLLLGGKKS
jgi:hypothetical protein